MPWLVVTIITLLCSLIVTLVLIVRMIWHLHFVLGPILGIVFGLLFSAIEVYFFVVVWSYRFLEILQRKLTAMIFNNWKETHLKVIFFRTLLLENPSGTPVGRA